MNDTNCVVQSVPVVGLVLPMLFYVKRLKKHEADVQQAV